MAEKTAIGHSKTINEDTEFIVIKQQSSTMVQLYHGTRESTRSLTKLQHQDYIIPMEALSGAAH